MGLHGLLFFYGVLGIFSCFWGLRKIPDNRGKSLVEVEEMYENDVDETKLWEKMRHKCTVTPNDGAKKMIMFTLKKCF